MNNFADRVVLDSKKDHFSCNWLGMGAFVYIEMILSTQKEDFAYTEVSCTFGNKALLKVRKSQNGYFKPTILLKNILFRLK